MNEQAQERIPVTLQRYQWDAIIAQLVYSNQMILACILYIGLHGVSLTEAHNACVVIRDSNE